MPRPETENLWRFLEDQPALKGFVLVGGTALELHIHHRLSEDLDLLTTAPRLPRARLDALQRIAQGQGFTWERQDSLASLEEFEIAGMDLLNYQQDYVVNGAVKLTFFTGDEASVRLVRSGQEDALRVATLPEIFALQSILTADRSKLRDWYDLYIMLREYGFTLGDMHRAFQRGAVTSKFDSALQRLCSGRPNLHDEGYESLMAEPPTWEAIQTFFRMERSNFERASARKAAEKQAHHPPHDSAEPT